MSKADSQDMADRLSAIVANSLDTQAKTQDLAHQSRTQFHRLFRTVVEETPGGMRRRLLLERAAYHWRIPECRSRLLEYAGTLTEGQLDRPLLTVVELLPWRESNKTLPNLKSSSDQVQAPLDGSMPPGFPAQNRGRVNTQLLGHLSLRQTERPARGDKAFWKMKSRAAEGRSQGTG